MASIFWAVACSIQDRERIMKELDMKDQSTKFGKCNTILDDLKSFFIFTFKGIKKSYDLIFPQKCWKKKRKEKEEELDVIIGDLESWMIKPGSLESSRSVTPTNI
jgi:hypothetical protein